MKKMTLRRVFTSMIALLLAVALLVADLQPIVAYAAPDAGQGGAAGGTTTGGTTTGGTANTTNTTKDPSPKDKRKLVQDELYAWAKERQEERAKNPHKEAFETAEKALNLTNEGVSLLISIIEDGIDGGDFDTAGMLSGLFDLASGILACVVPWGAVASAGLALFKTIFMAAMGGAEAPSEMALMEDRLNQRLDEIADQISEVQDQLSEMSDQINESTQMIISSVSTAIESQSDKEHLRDFMLSSGQGDFSYNQLRNYIYGSTTNNRNASTAYYALLQAAQLHDGSSAEIKNYYDLLYNGLVSNRESFHDYILGDGFGKSIVQTYYDVLADRPDLTAEMGMSAEVAAVQFAYDLYQTEMMMDQLILACNNYQFTQMAIYDLESYEYAPGKSVQASEILNADKQSTIAQGLRVGIDELRMQFAEDIVYVLAITESMVVEHNGNFYDHLTTDTDGTAYATVLEGQTLYFNRIPATASELFDLDTEGFRYVGNGVHDNDGIAVVENTTKYATITLVYTDENGADYPLGTIQLTDGANSTFAGGLGTEDSPYLIANASQFMNIGDDLEAYYRLANNIDMNSSKINPFGYGHNSVDSEVYEEFNGVLDGDGFTVSHLEIVGKTNAGLFGKIGSDGVVENLKVTDVSVTVSIKEAKTSTSTFTGGTLAGINNGLISSCYFENCSVNVTSETTNQDAERTVYLKYGGVAGVNNGDMIAVMVSRSQVEASSNHDFAGASTSGNKNFVYAGGICGTCPGTLSYVGVDENVLVKAYAKSILNPKSTVKPYVTARAGGITTNEGLKMENISNIYSAARDSLITATKDLKVESGWGKHWKNTSAKEDEWIPEAKSDDINDRKATKDDVLGAFAEDAQYKVSIKDNTATYTVGAVELDTTKLEVTVNGETVEDYYIVNLYGFTGHNESYDQVREVNVLVMFAAQINGEEVILTGEVPITVGKNFVKSFELINYETAYRKGDSAQTTSMVQRVDANGKTTTDSNGQLTILNADTATATIGTNKLLVEYAGLTQEVEIEVICNVHFNHFDYDNPEHFTYVETVEANCQHIGYDEYICAGCNETVHANRTGMVDHKYARDVSIPATCASTGVIGKIYCVYCNTVVEEEVVLPRLAHTFEHVDNADNHYCTTCEKYYAHDYVVSESLVDGKVTYTYTCYSCGYVGQKNDPNIITYEESLRPAVVVSDGYTQSVNDLVTVYVDLENNPGVNGANFGIRYDERLELVNWYEGAFFGNTSTEASHEVSCGYNFVWGNEAARSEKGGNLLKLQFRLPSDATPQDTYEVAVVYSVVAGSEGGFALPNDVCNTLHIPSNKPQKFKTKDGVIRLVERLPGDVDDSKKVNLRDALYLSNCLVNESQYPITQEVMHYGDVNLDAMVTVNDVVKLLQSISGGYGASLLYPEYRVQLNTNGYSYTPEALFVQLYGANNTYAALSRIEDAMKLREGYKFLGWYTRLEGGTKIDAANYETQLVSYDQQQKIQTLYAHWQKNTVSFDMNGATSEWLDKETYLGEGEQWITLIAPVEEYTVLFADPQVNTNSKTEKLSREFDYWLGSDGVKYYAGDRLEVSKLNMGELTLTAQWKDWTLNFPNLPKAGYDITQITWYTSNRLVDDAEVKRDGTEYEKIKAMTDRILYAKWTAPNTYYVHYDANGGTGEMADSKHIYDNKTTLSGNQFVNAYKVIFDYGWSGQANVTNSVTHGFKGWSKDGKTVVADDWVDNWTTENNKTITVYAIWSTETVDLKVPNTRTGYTFEGWYEDAEFTKFVTKESIAYTVTDACTLYAKWTPSNFTVKYYTNAMGTNGVSDNTVQCYTVPRWSVETNPDYVTYNKTGTYLDVPVTDHYNFVGWFTAPKGGTQITDSTGKVIKADAFAVNETPLYAHWSPMYSGTYVYDEDSLKAIGTTGTYHIVMDINLTTTWTPKDSFSGVIEGHDHTITGVKYNVRIEQTNDIINFGFVRELTGTIKNVVFAKTSMEIVKYKDGQHNVNVGGVVGYLNGGTLDNVRMVDPYVYNEHMRDVASSGNYSNAFAGGLVGFMSGGTVKNCSVAGSGGIYTWAKKATDRADVQAFSGGIVGYMTGGNVTGCSRDDGVKVESKSEVDGKNCASRSLAGGIIGKRDGGTYSNCTSTTTNLKASWDNGSYSKDYSYKTTGAIVASGG